MGVLQLVGTWRVVHVINKVYIKVYFDKCIILVARPTDWYYDTFKILKVGNFVEVDGWRYKSRTSLRYFKIVK